MNARIDALKPLTRSVGPNDAREQDAGAPPYPRAMYVYMNGMSTHDFFCCLIACSLGVVLACA
jgi:hypothetical protein